MLIILLLVDCLYWRASFDCKIFLGHRTTSRTAKNSGQLVSHQFDVYAMGAEVVQSNYHP